MNSGATMTLTKEQIRTAALNLNPAEREALAEELLLSIDEASRQEIDAVWLAEIRRRDDDYRAGKTTAKPVDEVLNRLRNKSKA
jgi:putative addiction module component (TIGR02574 family)